MRIILFLWFFPLVLFWGWFALSVNDWSFGFIMLSRELHDVVFDIYARTLGVERELLPGMIAGACAVDTALIMAIAAFRWRASWMPHLREMLASYWQDDPVDDSAYEELTAAVTVPARPAE